MFNPKLIARIVRAEIGKASAVNQIDLESLGGSSCGNTPV
jgi:hypothetical protein